MHSYSKIRDYRHWWDVNFVYKITKSGEKTRQIDRCETIFVKIQKTEMEEEKICENFVPT